MKFKFDVLKISTIIEEKRLIYGKKIEDYFGKNLKIFLNYSKTLFNNEFFGFFCCFSIVLLSLYKRSTIDIGQDSGLYLEIAQKILDGKKYYYDFFEFNFPLSFLLLTPPVYVANLLNISPIIIADYYINLLAILSLIWAYKILKNSQKIKSQTELSILIICFTAGFFIRGKTLIFNEFLTKTSFLLIFFYPFFSYYFYGVEKLKKIQKIYLGILSGFIISVKPNFIFLVAFFEIYRIFKLRNIKSLFEIHNLVCAFFVILYATLIFIFFKSFVENFSYMMTIYYEYKYGYLFKESSQKYASIFSRLQNYYLVYLALILVYIKILQKNELKNYLILAIISVFFINFSENFYLDQEIIFSSIGLSFVMINFVNFLKENKISILQYWPLFSSLTFFCFISSDIFIATSVLLCYLGLPTLLYLIFFGHFANSKSFFYIKILLTILFFSLIIFRFYSFELFEIFLTIFLLIIAFINLNLFIEKYRINKNFFHIINFLVFFATIGFLGNYFRAVFDSYSSSEYYFNLKSPNSQNQGLFEIAKLNLKDDDNLIIFGDYIENSYPFRNYAKFYNESEFSQYDVIGTSLKYPQIHNANEIYNNKAFKALHKQIIDPKNKLIILYNDRICTISNAEFLIRNDPEIKKYFIENFQFLTQDYSFIKDKSFSPKYTKEFLNDDEFAIVKEIDLTQPSIKRYNVFEAYIRK